MPVTLDFPAPEWKVVHLPLLPHASSSTTLSNATHVPPEVPTTMAPGEVWYNRSFTLGHGSYGTVYEAFFGDNAGVTRVGALKAQECDEDWKFEAVELEQTAISAVDHPNVVRLLGAKLYPKIRVSLMLFEKARGDLEDVIIGKLPPLERAKGLISDLLDRLAAVHAAGIIHRDIKPANLLLVQAGAVDKVAITDFGLSGFADEDGLTGGELFVGSFGYAPPEQYGGNRVGPAADVFAAGIVLFETLGTKDCVLWAENYEEAQELAARGLPDDSFDGWEWNEINRELIAMIKLMTHRDPAMRPTAAAAAAKIRGLEFRAVHPAAKGAKKMLRRKPVPALASSAGPSVPSPIAAVAVGKAPVPVVEQARVSRDPAATIRATEDPAATIRVSRLAATIRAGPVAAAATPAQVPTARRKKVPRVPPVLEPPVAGDLAGLAARMIANIGEPALELSSPAAPAPAADGKAQRQADRRAARQADDRVARQLDTRAARQLEARAARQADNRMERQVDNDNRAARQREARVARQVLPVKEALITPAVPPVSATPASVPEPKIGPKQAPHTPRVSGDAEPVGLAALAAKMAANMGQPALDFGGRESAAPAFNVPGRAARQDGIARNNDRRARQDDRRIQRQAERKGERKALVALDANTVSAAGLRDPFASPVIPSAEGPKERRKRQSRPIGVSTVGDEGKMARMAEAMKENLKAPTLDLSALRPSAARAARAAVAPPPVLEASMAASVFEQANTAPAAELAAAAEPTKESEPPAPAETKDVVPVSAPRRRQRRNAICGPERPVLPAAPVVAAAPPSAAVVAATPVAPEVLSVPVGPRTTSTMVLSGAADPELGPTRFDLFVLATITPLPDGDDKDDFDFGPTRDDLLVLGTITPLPVTDDSDLLELDTRSTSSSSDSSLDSTDSDSSRDDANSHDISPAMQVKTKATMPWQLKVKTLAARVFKKR